MGTLHKRTCRERPVCRSAGLQRNRKATHGLFRRITIEQKTERHMGRSLQNGGLVVLLEFFAFFVLRTLGAFCVPYIFCIPCALSYLQPFLSGAKIGQAQFGRPKLQHVAGYAGISTNQRILPKSPLLKVLGVLRTFSQEGSKWVWAKPKVFLAKGLPIPRSSHPKKLTPRIATPRMTRIAPVMRFSVFGCALFANRAATCAKASVLTTQRISGSRSGKPPMAK